MLKIENIQQKHKNGIHLLLKTVNQVDNLDYSLTSEWLDYIIRETSDSVFMAVDRTQLVGIGTCMINEMDNTHAIINIVVHPQYRNKGVGSLLYNQVMSYAKDKNIKTIEAYIKKRLNSAMAFTEKRGFHTTCYVWKLDLETNKIKLDLIRPNNELVSFRNATIKDSQVYAYIINQTFGDPLDEKALGRLFQDPSVTVYILERDGQSVGSATIQLRTSLSIGYIYDVAIVEQYRRQELGGYMLKRCIEELQANNIDIATLTVSGKNKQALDLYHKVGFREVDMDILGELRL